LLKPVPSDVEEVSSAKNHAKLRANSARHWQHKECYIDNLYKAHVDNIQNTIKETSYRLTKKLIFAASTGY
jgi:hypothetical protein